MGWQGGRELFQLIATSLYASLESGDRLEIAMNVGRPGLGRRLVRAARHRLTGKARPDDEAGIRALVGRHIPATRAAAKSFDVIGPLTRTPDSPGVPWLGYIPDVQHRRLPDMFSVGERAARDRNFRSLLAGASLVIVNAADVASDLRRLYPEAAAEILPLPFAACAEPDWFEEGDDVAARYGIHGPFFLCSNQFWKHKNHRVLLAAAALARHEGAPIRLVLTGETRDYRHPTYFAELLREIESAGIAPDVHILGLIPKADQIQLMRSADAVVQPSLFEGGPGGGSIYNAIALGRPTIVSDLPVNREIGSLATHFFDPLDPKALLDALRRIQASEFGRSDPARLLLESSERRRAFGDALRAAFAKAAGR